jgi:hypothetical protein
MVELAAGAFGTDRYLEAWNSLTREPDHWQFAVCLQREGNQNYSLFESQTRLHRSSGCMGDPALPNAPTGDIIFSPNRK